MDCKDEERGEEERGEKGGIREKRERRERGGQREKRKGKGERRGTPEVRKQLTPLFCPLNCSIRASVKGCVALTSNDIRSVGDCTRNI